MTPFGLLKDRFRKPAVPTGAVRAGAKGVIGLIGLLAGAICLAGVLGSPGGRLRLRILGEFVIGDLDAVGIRELWSIVRPRGDYYSSLPELARSHSAYVALRLPASYAHDSASGEAMFLVHCAECHGAHATQRDAPTLTSPELAHGSSDWAIFRNIRYGLPGTAMRPHALSTGDIWRIVGYLRRVQQATTTGMDGNAIRFSNAPSVTDSMLTNAADDPSQWLSYSGDYTGRRLRDLPDLRAATLQRLRLAWIYQLPEDPPVSEVTPLVVGSEMLVASAEDIIALDLATGAVRWEHHRQLPTDLRICCVRARRGLAVAGNQVFAGTLDAHLLALNLETGAVNWDVAVDPDQDGLSITGAPLVVADRIIVGVAGGEFGVRGFLDAFDPASGRRLWRFQTILDPDDPHSDWSSSAARHGGGSTWLTGSVDLKLGLLYWGIGNPSPPFRGDVRPGDNRYTNSVVALDLRDGHLRWSYQFTPHDTHDWDAAQVPVLVDSAEPGRVRHLLLWANRNGFFYVLDRETGEFVAATPFARQTWNEGFDGQGRPQVREASVPTLQGTVVYPSVFGATNWWSPSADPGLGLFFLAIRDSGDLVYLERHPTGEGGMILGGRSEPLPGEAPRVAVVALRIADGRVWWRHSFPQPGPLAMGGLLALRSGVLFGGYNSTFFALDSRTGATLWSLQLGVPISAAPIAVQAPGRTYVSLVAGHSVFTFVVDSDSSATQPHHTAAARVPRSVEGVGRSDHAGGRHFVRKST
jgi:alcohol dehydrogenase (cytochrome c)